MASKCEYLSVREIAKQYGFCRHTVSNWVSRGAYYQGFRVRLKATRFGRTLRIHKQDLQDFLAELNPGVLLPREDPAGSRDAKDALDRRFQMGKYA